MSSAVRRSTERTLPTPSRGWRVGPNCAPRVSSTVVVAALEAASGKKLWRYDPKVFFCSPRDNDEMIYEIKSSANS